ncbi:glutamate--tRNA ligase [Helicobacter baculiformis]|uniref:Glutamate--tRNA ligase n=1 Tax=Helicobacter baculiformis TaxID=427351 RepID=A0ABV7ZGX3_9HELI|nr:glutamate--tRNA ligase [Helicobacter baculiformis]
MLRFAPSPTGNMHIGNLRAALLNFIVARQLQRPLMVRIEDTDSARNIAHKDQEILELLGKMGISWDRLVYQSANLPTHLDYAQKLLDRGLAFYCHCTPEFLQEQKQRALQEKRPFRYHDAWALLQEKSNPNPVVRLRGSTHALSFKDQIKGVIRFEPHELDSFVILRANKTPTYNFACACDDFTYKISYIIRGEDHISNTPKQILIQQALAQVLEVNYQEIAYAHLPLILNHETGKKMSKRDAASSVVWLLEQGFLPQSVANYLISLGYNPPTDTFSLHESCAWFELTRLSSANARFDLSYLRHLNHKHLLNLEPQELQHLLKLDHPQKGALARLFLEDSSTLQELQSKLEAMFSPKDIEQDYEGENFYDRCLKLYRALQTLDFAQLEDFAHFKQVAMQASQLKGKDFFKPLRILFTGQVHGMELSLLYPFVRAFAHEILILKVSYGS